MEQERHGDAALWARSLAGDGTAFGALFDRHRARVFGHALRLVETRQDAEDILAAAYLELWRRRAEVRLVNGSVLPWLLVTATNLARNVTRSTRRYRALLARLPRETSEPDVADVVEARHLGDGSLREALRQLRTTDQSLVALVALEGYSLADAAELLNISPSAAKTRLHRARTRVRELVGDIPPHDRIVTVGGAR